MKKLMQIKRSEKGFTLIEVIITIVVAAILASFLITFMGTAITRSSDPLFQTQNMATAEATMEKISANYTSYLATGDSTYWTNLGSGHITTGATTSADISINGGAISIPTFNVKEVTVTEGDQKLVSYFMQ